MERFGLRRGLRALVLVTAIIGLTMVGFGGQASAGGFPINPIAGASNTASSNTHLTANVSLGASPSAGRS
jgi:hypothetical protein